MMEGVDVNGIAGLISTELEAAPILPPAVLREGPGPFYVCIHLFHLRISRPHHAFSGSTPSRFHLKPPRALSIISFAIDSPDNVLNFALQGPLRERREL